MLFNYLQITRSLIVKGFLHRKQCFDWNYCILHATDLKFKFSICRINFPFSWLSRLVTYLSVIVKICFMRTFSKKIIIVINAQKQPYNIIQLLTFCPYHAYKVRPIMCLLYKLSLDFAASNVLILILIFSAGTD